MADLTPLKIASQPGCKRDGTLLEGENYVDNQWCRYQFKKGLPRKIGGYRRMTDQLSGISRGLNVFNHDNILWTHSGWSDGLQQLQIDLNGNVSNIADRTPAAFSTNALNMWQFDSLYDTTLTSTTLLACAAPNLNDICSGDNRAVYHGNILANTPLLPTTSPDVAGGVMALGPFAVSYGNDGVVNWSPANDILGVWQSDRPTAAKLLFGLPIRAGAGNGPSALIWGAEVLLRMTYIGTVGGPTWNYDQITTQYSILSSQSVIEYDGIYYWPGIDHFLSFNGVIQEVENSMNQNWFYDNLNYDQAQKVFAIKMPRWGEIWWCYPRGSATECTHAVIYNVRLSKLLGYNVWYDTELPNGGRSAGQYSRVFRRPFMAGVKANSNFAKINLLITTPSTSVFNYNVILNGEAAVNVTATNNASTNTTATEIAAGSYPGWSAVANGAAVLFTALTAGERSSSYSFSQTGAASPTAGTFNTIVNGAPKYKIWEHDYQTDEIDGSNTLAVQSYFETNAIFLGESQQPSNKSIYVDYIEPDFVQSGNMTVQVLGSMSNARAPDNASTPVSFTATATTTEEQIVKLGQQRRQLRFRFESNVAGGDYQMGDVIAQVRPGDGRITS
jgi:hypothetical protein